MWELVHTDPQRDISIYRDSTLPTPLCMKVQRITSDSQRQSAASRHSILQSLSHPYICPAYSFQAYESDGNQFTAQEMEWAGDSLGVICDRQSRSWTDSDSVVLLASVASALAFAQARGIAHRNIHPMNVFRSPDGEFKISDFEDDLEWTDDRMPRFAMFLCPLQRKGYAQRLIGECKEKVACDPYKSDVYSLGLLVVYCVCPEAVGEFGNQIRLEKSIDSLSVSRKVKDLLRGMVNADEDRRPSFVELVGQIHTVLIPDYISALNDEQSSESDRAVALQLLFRCRLQVCFAVRDPLPHKKRRLVLRKKEFIPAAEESPVSVPSAVLTCKHCSNAISTDISWRLEYLGSIMYETAKQYCSLLCFQSEVSLPILETDFSVEEQQPELTEDLLIQNVLPLRINQPTDFPCHFPTTRLCVYCHTRPEFFFFVFDCGQHICCGQDLSKYMFKMNPGILTECPRCLSSTKKLQLSLSIVNTNLAYRDVYFKLIPVRFEKWFGRVLLACVEGSYPVPFTTRFAEEILRGCCHFCEKSVSDLEWKCLFHGGWPALVCSSDCISACLEPGADCICPKCSDLIVRQRVENAFTEKVKFESYWGSLVDGGCYLCMYGVAESEFSCGHTFCNSCLQNFGKATIEDFFPCLFCGVSLHSSELPLPNS